MVVLSIVTAMLFAQAPPILAMDETCNSALSGPPSPEQINTALKTLKSFQDVVAGENSKDIKNRLELILPRDPLKTRDLIFEALSTSPVYAKHAVNDLGYHKPRPEFIEDFLSSIIKDRGHCKKQDDAILVRLKEYWEGKEPQVHAVPSKVTALKAIEGLDARGSRPVLREALDKALPENYSQFKAALKLEFESRGDQGGERVIISNMPDPPRNRSSWISDLLTFIRERGYFLENNDPIRAALKRHWNQTDHR